MQQRLTKGQKKVIRSLFNLNHFILLIFLFLIISTIIDFILIGEVSFFDYLLINCWESGIFALGVIAGWILVYKNKNG